MSAESPDPLLSALRSSNLSDAVKVQLTEALARLAADAQERERKAREDAERTMRSIAELTKGTAYEAKITDGVCKHPEMAALLEEVITEERNKRAPEPDLAAVFRGQLAGAAPVVVSASAASAPSGPLPGFGVAGLAPDVQRRLMSEAARKILRGELQDSA